MRMRLDQPRQRQAAAAVQDLDAGGSRARCDPAIADQDIGRSLAERPDIADEQVSPGHLNAAPRP